MYTLKQAAQKVKKSKSTLHRDVTTGKISGQKGKNGEWLIQPSELERVYSLIPYETENEEATGQIQAVFEAHETALMQQKIEFLERMLQEAKAERDDWKHQAQRLLLSAPEQQDNQKENKGFWYHMKATFKA